MTCDGVQIAKVLSRSDLWTTSVLWTILTQVQTSFQQIAVISTQYWEKIKLNNKNNF